MKIDLLLVGPEAQRTITWSLGEVVRAGSTPQQLRATLERWLAQTSADALMGWDPRLGPPDPKLATTLASGRGDIWHAGLLVGTAGQPGLIDFVAPNWMLNRDPDADREATSWRTSFAACLVRTAVFRELGLPCGEFETVTGATLEWAHRAIARGAVMRHVPALVTQPVACADPPSLADEVRFVAYRYGRFWARWACMRAAITEYAPAAQLLRAWQHVPAKRPYDEPAPYRSPRGHGAPDLATAKVTVLIPTLDRYPYLHVVLDNLRAQTVRPHEIIIIDQTARDRRDMTIAEKFADLPLRLLYQDEPGQCASRNAGLQISTGDYILFIDDDDELVPTLIEEHLHNLHELDADVSSGMAQEVGTAELAPEHRFVRASDVFPTNNTLIRREVLHHSGLFDLAFNRAPRADGELGMRVYLSGAFMVLDQGISVLHHHAPQGGLRTHRARVITYRMSREMLTKRSLPHTSEIYLMSRYYTPRQLREALWLRTFGTLSGRGAPGRRLVKAVIGSVLLPHTLREIQNRKRQSVEWLQKFPLIDTLSES
ncbi:MAG TPA: glycosyltransferase family A protein [Kofleriaceae bacterium]